MPHKSAMKQQQQQTLYNGGNSSSRNSNSRSSNDTKPQQQQHNSDLRPYDTLGPPSDPIEFPRPQLVRGRRDTVVCYNAITDEHEVLENVLFRDCLTTVGQRYGNHNNSSNNSDGGRSPSSRRTKGNSNHHCRNHSSSYSKNQNNNNDTIVTQAYWPIPYKAKIQTIMGHVEYVVDFCFYFCTSYHVCFSFSQTYSNSFLIP